MPRIILITNPANDQPTKYLDSWSKLIIEAVKKQKDTIIFELNKARANKQELTQLIQKEKPQLIIFNGHGDNKTIVGFDQKVLIRCDDNEHLLKGKIVHSMSCDSGKELGPKCIKLGTLSYVGYEEKFELTHLNKQTDQDRLNDPVAGFFLKPAFEVILALIEGATVEEAYKRSQKIYVENLRLLMTSRFAEYNTKVASRLYHNLKYQVCLGDSNVNF